MIFSDLYISNPALIERKGAWCVVRTHGQEAVHVEWVKLEPSMGNLESGVRLCSEGENGSVKSLLGLFIV